MAGEVTLAGTRRSGPVVPDGYLYFQMVSPEENNAGGKDFFCLPQRFTEVQEN